jgi:hypothetical protein
MALDGKPWQPIDLTAAGVDLPLSV